MNEYAGWQGEGGEGGRREVYEGEEEGKRKSSFFATPVGRDLGRRGWRSWDAREVHVGGLVANSYFAFKKHFRYAEILLAAGQIKKK